MGSKEKVKIALEINYGIKCMVFCQKKKKFVSSVVYLDESYPISFRWIDMSLPFHSRVFPFQNIKRVEFNSLNNGVPAKMRNTHEFKSFLVSVTSKENFELLVLCEDSFQKNNLACAFKHFYEKRDIKINDMKYFCFSTF